MISKNFDTFKHRPDDLDEKLHHPLREFKPGECCPIIIRYHLRPGECVSPHPSQTKRVQAYFTSRGMKLGLNNSSGLVTSNYSYLLNNGGYRQSKAGGRTGNVMLLMGESFFGIHPGLEACHCDGNRTNDVLVNCRFDTKRGNEGDKKLHGTDSAGERNGKSVLAEALVIEARQRVKAGASVTDLAREFGVSQVTLDLAVHGDTWQCIDELESPASRKVQSSEFCGISWDEEAGKWRTHARVDGKNKKLGRFTSESDALFFFERQIRLDPSCKSRSNNLLSFDFRHQPEAVPDDIQNAKPVGPAKPAGFQVFSKPKAKPESKDDGGKA